MNEAERSAVGRFAQGSPTDDDFRTLLASSEFSLEILALMALPTAEVSPYLQSFDPSDDVLARARQTLLQGLARLSSGEENEAVTIGMTNAALGKLLQEAIRALEPTAAVELLDALERLSSGEDHYKLLSLAASVRDQLELTASHDGVLTAVESRLLGGVDRLRALELTLQMAEQDPSPEFSLQAAKLWQAIGLNDLSLAACDEAIDQLSSMRNNILGETALAVWSTHFNSVLEVAMRVAHQLGDNARATQYLLSARRLASDQLDQRGTGAVRTRQKDQLAWVVRFGQQEIFHGVVLPDGQSDFEILDAKTERWALASNRENVAIEFPGETTSNFLSRYSASQYSKASENWRVSGLDGILPAAVRAEVESRTVDNPLDVDVLVSAELKNVPLAFLEIADADVLARKARLRFISGPYFGPPAEYKRPARWGLVVGEGVHDGFDLREKFSFDNCCYGPEPAAFFKALSEVDVLVFDGHHDHDPNLIEADDGQAVPNGSAATSDMQLFAARQSTGPGTAVSRDGSPDNQNFHAGLRLSKNCWLTAAQVRAADFTPPIGVILAACRSTGRPAVASDDWTGVAAALLEKGVQWVIGTQWPLAVIPGVTELFVGRLLNNVEEVGPAEGLRITQLAAFDGEMGDHAFLGQVSVPWLVLSQ